MKIGILQCDNVRSSLSPEFGEYPDMITRYLAAEDESFEFVTYRAHDGVLPDSPDECDAFILTGSRCSVFDPGLLWVNSLLNFVVQLHKARIKTVGICFGHQLIAEAMGGKVERADCGWQIGVHEARVLQTQTFIQPHAESFRIAMICEDQIQELPENAQILATSPYCEYMMLQYEEHMLGFQGHPEFSHEFAKALFNLRHKEFPQKRFATGLSDLNEKELDNNLLFGWIANFIRLGSVDE